MRKNVTVNDIIEMQDNAIRDILKQWKTEANCRCQFQYKYSLIDNGTLFIYTCEPGRLVGKQGALCKKYDEMLFEKLGRSGYRRVKFVEVDPYLI